MIIKFNIHLSIYLLLLTSFCSSLMGDPVFELPDEIIFAGKTVPIEKYDVESRIESILNTLAIDRKAYMQSLIDKQNDFLPEAKNILREFGSHPDFAYIIPVESDFNLRAFSSRKASGPWQLMPATARMYGLRVDNQVDERNLLEKSTLAAAEHLIHLMDIFNDDVFLVLAAFNNGEGNVASMLESQNSNDFWKCISNSETDIYVPKIIAFKIILSDPKKYGFKEPQDQDKKLYEPCMISLGSKELLYKDICQFLNISYREFYIANPHIKYKSYKVEDQITKYTAIELFIPRGSKNDFLRELRNNGYLSNDNIASSWNSFERSTNIEKYIVKDSDNIESIAFKFGINWKRIVEMNDLEIVKMTNGTETAKIYSGQELIINR